MNEKDLVVSKHPVAEPPTKPAGVIKNRLLSILSDNPDQYGPALEAYAMAPEVKGETLLGATPNNGDIGKMEEIEGPLPTHFENILRPFKRGDEYFLRRPSQGELIYVGPKQPKVKPPILQNENPVSKTNSEIENNPYLNAPAKLTEKAA